MKKVVIIGAGGHGKVIADIVLKSGDRLVGFLDDDVSLPETYIGFPVLGTVEQVDKYGDCSFVIAIGNAEIREKIAKRSDVDFYTAVHPKAVVSDVDTFIGRGTVIMANAVLNACSHIGEHCIINTGAVVEHDNRLDDFVHVSVGAKLAGNVRVGKGAWIGIGAVVKNDLDICGGCMIGAGAVVVRDITEPGTYVGVPAERTDMKKVDWGGVFPSWIKM